MAKRQLARARQRGVVLDSCLSVGHVLMEKSPDTIALVDDIVARFIDRALLPGRKRRNAVVLRRDKPVPDDPRFPYWSLAVEADSAWWKDLADAATESGHTVSKGTSTVGYGPDDCGARPYLRIHKGVIQLFDQNRRQGTRVTLTLAGRSYEARTVKFRFRDQARKAPRRPDPREVHPLKKMKDMRALGKARRISQFDTNQAARDAWLEIALSERAPTLPLSEARKLCEKVGIAVFEVAMKEKGCLHVEPAWERRPGGLGWSNLHVSIAVQAGLPEEQQRLALLHEIGHFVHHFDDLTAFLLMAHRIAVMPSLEGLIGSNLTRSWRAKRRRVMEREADAFASNFIISEPTIDGLRGARITPSYLHGTLLQEVFKALNASWSPQQSFFVDEAERHWQRILSEGHRTDGSWFDRLAPCVVSRYTLADMLSSAEESREIHVQMSHLIEALMDPPPLDRSGPVPPEHHMLARITEPEVPSVFGSPDQRDPMILERPGGAPASGYLPLCPAFTAGDRIDTFDWVRVAFGESDGCGDLEYWRPHADAQGRGLMLFPMSPSRYAIRMQFP